MSQKARQQDRAAHPENYPPLQYWWGRALREQHCLYFPRDWGISQEELDFYHKVASDYKNGIVYDFNSYDLFLAYSHFVEDEQDRWRDFFECGHVHAPDEDLEAWKNHEIDEHHLHEEGWYPYPEPPLVWDSWGQMFEMHRAHLKVLSDRERRVRRRS